MGWLELLPLLRRVLPLLDRLAPMLESLVAGRVGGRAAAEANSASVAELTRGSATMQAALDEQSRLIAALGIQAEDLRTEIKQAHTRQADQFAAVYRGLRTLLILILAAVVLCLVLLLVLVLHHR